MTSEETSRQRPTSGRLESSLGKILAVVKHPAFRIGFLDARAGRALDHDDIARRIVAETPAGSLSRLGYGSGFFPESSVEIAQYRYEEGREAFVLFAPQVRRWGYPDYPPVAIQNLCSQLAEERSR